jgi:hypothetical protein
VQFLFLIYAIFFFILQKFILSLQDSFYFSNITSVTILLTVLDSFLEMFVGSALRASHFSCNKLIDYFFVRFL